MLKQVGQKAAVAAAAAAAATASAPTAMAECETFASWQLVDESSDDDLSKEMRISRQLWRAAPETARDAASAAGASHAVCERTTARVIHHFCRDASFKQFVMDVYDEEARKDIQSRVPTLYLEAADDNNATNGTNDNPVSSESIFDRMMRWARNLGNSVFQGVVSLGSIIRTLLTPIDEIDDGKTATPENVFFGVLVIVAALGSIIALCVH
ncbi:Uncharacterized protein PBTT_05814 [Plasmodiophora brassicae]|uniref:Uncharacterized protein n=1 Tax=Plasmodiophora brassicae TaxID=37360 RepID=A0A0G4J3A6_PLABS|nr:hypothetical protein PBRA_002330 [Plasmodiophora brassicae]